MRSNKAQMYDFSSSQWTELSNLNVPRQRHACGSATKSDGSSVAIVAGGLDSNSVEFFDFTLETWR